MGKYLHGNAYAKANVNVWSHSSFQRLLPRAAQGNLVRAA